MTFKKDKKEFERVKSIVSNVRRRFNLPEPTDKEVKEIIRLNELSK